MKSESNPVALPFVPENAPFTREQRAWLNGFLAGLFASHSPDGQAAAGKTKTSLAILYGSQTGTAEQLAKRLADEASRRDFEPRVLEMNAHASIDLTREQRLLIVTSTWGDGDPPDNAVDFWNYLNSDQAPRLEHLAFSVLALGDRNYADFCGAGKKFDLRLEQLGAKRIQPRVDCDTDYEAPARSWMAATLSCLEKEPRASAPGKVEIQTAPVGYSKANPFPARLLVNRQLNGLGSAKETRHFEISLKDSGLSYEAGDALGIQPANCPELAGEVLSALNCDGEEAVKVAGGREVSLRKALLENFQITRVPPALFTAVAERSGDATLAGLLQPENKAGLDQFLFGRQVIHLLLAYPSVRFAPDEFVALLPPLQPRLYSIASSPKAHADEVHLTVAIVRYEAHGRPCKGVCSTFLADRVNEGTPIPIFVQPSPGFRPPRDPDTPIIMIGPGTGIAPFRAFLEERRAVGAGGKSWLFFGDQCAATDFLYRDELEAMRRDGHLSRLDTAFSRDQAEKIYVQQRMIEQAAGFWSWLEAGAHVYVCGDARRMARDVDAALHQVIQTAGGKTAAQAAEYVQRLKQEKRYQRDVY